MIFFEFGFAQILAIAVGLVLVAIGVGYPLWQRLMAQRSNRPARDATVTPDSHPEFRRPGDR